MGRAAWAALIFVLIIGIAMHDEASDILVAPSAFWHLEHAAKCRLSDTASSISVVNVAHAVESLRA